MAWMVGLCHQPSTNMHGGGGLVRQRGLWWTVSLDLLQS